VLAVLVLSLTSWMRKVDPVEAIVSYNNNNADSQFDSRS
jgi:hypothetical protein